MTKPRIFLGSSGKQEKLLQALTRGLEDVAHVEPWTTSFNPGTTTLERLLELTREVDFAAFVFAQDDWTTNSPLPSIPPGTGQASPRDNVVFEAGLFGGAPGLRGARRRRRRGRLLRPRPFFAAGPAACAGPSSSMRAAPSFQATSLASRAYGTAKRRRRPRLEWAIRSAGRRSRTRAALPVSKGCGGRFP